MKQSNFVLLFFVLCLPFFFVMLTKTNRYSHTVQKTNQYNRILDNAVADTVESLIELDDSGEVFINRDVITVNFFESLYSGFGAMDNLHMQALLRTYVPIISLVEEDGFSLLYSDIVMVNGASTIKQLWTEKIPFIEKSNNGYIYYSTNDEVTVLLQGNSEPYHGDAKTIKDKYIDNSQFTTWYNNSSLKLAVSDYSKFNNNRQTIVVQTVSDTMAYYVNQHNRIGQSYGINYVFSFPESSLDYFTRSIDGPSIFVLFQGYPLTSQQGDVFSKVAFGGARYTKSAKYYVQQGSDSYFYYHKEDCVHVTNKLEMYTTREEAATTGAYACEVCKP